MKLRTGSGDKSNIRNGQLHSKIPIRRRTMLTKLLSVGITMSALIISIMPAIAEPNSCKNSAITPAEREAVSIMQNMYSIQLNLEKVGVSLDELSHQKSAGYDSSNTASVNYYNDLVAKYNDVVKERNQLSDQYNQLKDSFNALTPKISPSKNYVFITCLNGELSLLEANTASINADDLTREVEDLKR